MPASDLYAEVAVPLPISGTLTYSVPEVVGHLLRPGMRVRVPVGRRRLVGIVTALHERPPEGFKTRPVGDVLDLDPVVTPELLSLAEFIVDYYLAPIGEVLRGMLPGKLRPWGDRRVWLTDMGALSRPRDDCEAALVETLMETGPIALRELRQRITDPALPAVVGRLLQQGRLAAATESGRGSRYIKAVERVPGILEDQLELCGRSRPGRDVITFLHGIARPATNQEVCSAADCGHGVLRRLVKLGLLRQFTQVEAISLDRHRLQPEDDPPPIRLRPDQQQAVEALTEAISGSSYQPFLLSGVTGSGKTEVYLRAAAAALDKGGSAIFLVPEIALVPALARASAARFGSLLAILHSAMSVAERLQEWERIRRGEARVVLGPRSAIFAPVGRLDLLVVDEEQDGAYKQESTPRYNARDLALVRGQQSSATVLLVSATPSLETRFNVERSKVHGLALTQRVGDGRMPLTEVVDMRLEAVVGRPGEIHFSERLRELLAATIAAGDQTILLRNRRGYSPVLLCRACGEDMRCDGCGLPRTYHRRSARLVCHYCGSSLPAPTTCPACEEEESLEPIGAGTEKVEESFRALYPGIAVDVLDRDAAQRPGGAAAVLERFGRGEVQVLIGTQMVSKGHHFPSVALAAVLLADTYLNFPDFRSVERTYSLLTQLAGRAGRGDRRGRVVIQSYHPDHYAIQAAMRNDDEGFAAEEMRFRRMFHYPPYSRMVQLLWTDTNRQRAEAGIGDLARRIELHPLGDTVRLSGPAPAPLERLRGRWRIQLLLRASSGAVLRRILAEVLPDRAGHSALTIDVDPLQLT